MAKINNENLIEEIKSRTNIVDIVSRSVELRRNGSNYTGRCPFHNEKTPSFVVSEAKQIFTCFGCGATGDVFEFVMKITNCSFPEALERLANECGIEYESGYGKNDKKDLYYDINKEAARFFFKEFTSKKNPGLDYMLKRGVEPAILRKFGIGYADGQWDSLLKYFTSKGISPKILLELGLISESKGKYYDKFRNRVMFPIINTRGKVIGFGGRILGDGTPKYLNSPENPVFQKKNNLYGLNLTRTDISKEDCVVLVEGYMDVIGLYQSGIKNVGASLGTALTENQAKMLKRYTKNIVLSYDADQAGRNAAMRGIDVLYKEGCKPKVLHVTDGKDPDEFVKLRGKEAFKALIDHSLGFIDYKIDTVKNQFDLESYDGKVDFIKNVAEILKPLSPVEREMYVKKIAEEFKISENAVKLEIGDSQEVSKDLGINAENVNEEREKIQQEINSATLMIEKNLIKLSILEHDYFSIISDHRESFKTPYGSKLFDAVSALYAENNELDVLKLKDSLEKEELFLLEDILENVHFAGKEDAILDECLMKLKMEADKDKERLLLMQLSIAEEDDNTELINRLTKELMNIQNRINRKG